MNKLTVSFQALAPSPKMLVLIMCPDLVKLFPSLIGWDKTVEGYHGVYDLLDEQIERHEKNLNPDEEPKDYIDAYLIEMKKKEEEGDTKSYFYKDLGKDCLRCTLHDLFLAGEPIESF